MADYFVSEKMQGKKCLLSIRKEGENMSEIVLGNVVVTRKINYKMEENDSFGIFVLNSIQRHKMCTCCLQQDYLCKSVRSVGD